jgi:hypothetical protein
MQEKICIIYIIGAGRSGTTLLDIILGNTPEIFSAGELNRFVKRKGIPHDARDTEAEQFWAGVRQNLEKENMADFETLYNISKKIEYHSSVFNLFRTNTSNPWFAKYISFQKALFKNILKQAIQYNKTIICDSSKYPMRGLLLSKIFGGKISFIYIKRNPHTVVDSFQKKDIEQPPKSRITANIYLLAVNAIANKVIKRVKKENKVAIINYDDLIRDPTSTLDTIEKGLNINLQQAKNLINANQPLQVGLLFDGNRLRLKNQITFNKKAQDNKNKKLIDSLFYPLHKLIWYK